ncbi:MAG: response regulator transcription factor [Planctomycetota bacterium]
MRILLVEDEVELRQAIARRLRAQGHGVDEASDIAAAEHLLHVFQHAVLILDRLLPDGDSLDRLEAWRAQGLKTPALVLTALDRVADRVDGLQAGADDYLIKPFAMDELVARVASLGRRAADVTPTVVRVGALLLDLGRRELRVSGTLIPLRPKEHSLLTLLVQRRGRVVAREEIIDACWDEAREPASNVEETLVASLRRKIAIPGLIRTVRGAGYLLEDPACAP